MSLEGPTTISAHDAYFGEETRLEEVTRSKTVRFFWRTKIYRKSVVFCFATGGHAFERSRCVHNAVTRLYRRAAHRKAARRLVVTKPSKPFFSFLFALHSQFTRICRNFHYVFITLQPEKARLKDSERDARRLQRARSGVDSTSIHHSFPKSAACGDYFNRRPTAGSLHGSLLHQFPMACTLRLAILLQVMSLENLFSAHLQIGNKPPKYEGRCKNHRGIGSIQTKGHRWGGCLRTYH